MKPVNGTPKKLPASWLKMYNNLRVFYKNPYGRAGFYILLGFAVITLLTPFFVQHPAYFYVAPEEDTHVASLLSHTALLNLSSNSGNARVYSPMATDVLSDGATGAIYFATSSGDLYYYGLGVFTTNESLGSYGLLFNSSYGSSAFMLKPIMIPLINCYKELSGYSSNTLIERFVIMPFSNGKIVVGIVENMDYGLKVPKFVYFETINYTGKILGNIVSNSLPFTSTTFTPLPSYLYQNQGVSPPGEIYFITNNTTGNYLVYDQLSPFSTLHVIKLSMNDPAGVQVYGKDFCVSDYNQSRIMVYNSTTVMAFNPSGNLTWDDHIAGGLNDKVGLQIPCQYQITYKKNNSAYFASGTNLSRINLQTGNVSYVDNVHTDIVGISVTPGKSGPPSHILVAGGGVAVALSYNISGALSASTITLPPDSGNFSEPGVYDPVSNSIIVDSQKGNVLSFGLDCPLNEPFSWSAGIPNNPAGVSAPLYFTDDATGVGEIAVVSYTSTYSYLSIYNSTAQSYTPTPPMAKTPSGNHFFLGTTTTGADVWSRFLEAFWSDWFFGISIGLLTIVLSVVVALYVGYKGKLVGSVLETFSLALFLVPSLALLIALASILPGNANFEDLILIVGLTGWPFAAFTLIGLVKGIKSRSYVEASRLFGSKTFPILRRHILPNIGPLLLYLLALSIGGGIGAVSGLEFLGLAPLEISTWGGMLNDLYDNYFQVANAPQWVFPPVIALTLFIVALIFISRGMDEVVNPRLRRR